jgi:hypothetical protein
VVGNLNRPQFTLTKTIVMPVIDTQIVDVIIIYTNNHPTGFKVVDMDGDVIYIHSVINILAVGQTDNDKFNLACDFATEYCERNYLTISSFGSE